MVNLRPYQLEAEKAVFKKWHTFSKLLLVLPTGTGKTVVFGDIARQVATRKGARVLILAHRGELLQQASDKIYSISGLRCSVEKAESHSYGTPQLITVGSVQTLCREQRLGEFPRDYFKLIIIDEAHHALSDSYQNVLNYFNRSKVLGVTATPDRGDMRNLGSVFEDLAYEYSLVDAIKQGYLSPIKAATIPLDIDLSGVSMQNGDFKAGDVGHALEPYLEQIAEEMVSYCKDRKTVVFLPLIDTSEKFRDILNAKGFRAVEVNGSSKNREQILDDFDKGKYNVLCNSMLLTEGWDCPSVDCVVVLRPTKVRSLYCQMVGRGTRLCEGKDHLLLLDFLWHSERHSLVHPAHLINGKEDVIKKMTQNLAEADGAIFDIEEASEQAEKDAKEERENKLIEELKKQKKKQRRLIDPLAFEMKVSNLDFSSFEAVFAWQEEPPTDKQIAMIENFGLDASDISTKGQATMLIDSLLARSKEGLATPKQINLLEKRGFQNVAEWSFDSAKNMITRIQKNGWKVPFGVYPRSYIPPKEKTDEN